MDWFHLLFAAAAAGAVGVAVGFFREAKASSEQVTYLRGQIARFMGEAPTNPPARLPVPHQGGGRS